MNGEAMREVLERQRGAFVRDGAPTLAVRRDALQRLRAMLVDHQGEICEAISSDFGHRARQESLLADLFPSVTAIDYIAHRLPQWLKPSRRGVEWYFLPGRARVIRQPLGVVGIIAPWNYPILLAIPPMAAALAAGNRVMLKPSEYTPATAALLERLLGAAFAPEQVAVVTGDATTGAAFTELPFDHLLFTGSTAVGRKVMEAAARNLVPVTLELGGKSPVIVERGFNVARTAHGIATGKLLNAGQSCVAPDYALIPADEVELHCEAIVAAMRKLYPTIADNPDYTAIIHRGHRERLSALLDDARAQGAEIVQVGEGDARRVPPTLLLSVTDTMRVMQEEIFGPILPIVPYRDLDEAIAYVNARPRPLALYYFGPRGAGRRAVLERTTSGGVTINDTMLHLAQEDLPFGGIGPSGMGAYHAEEGFLTFTHEKAVFAQGRWSPIDLMRPPYGGRFDRLMRFLLH